MTKIISVTNHKGGVGKTTTAANLGAGLSLKNKKVLLIDLDPQANLTLHFSCPINLEKNIYTSLKYSEALPICVINEHLSIVPSCLDLSVAEIELSSEAGREYLLKELITPIQNDYDYILIDCPPSLGLLTINSLACSNFIIIPIDMSSFAINGMQKIFYVVDKVQKRLNKNLIEYRILLTKVDLRKTIHRNVKDMIIEKYGDNLFENMISTNVSLEEVQILGEDIFSYNPNSSGAKNYMSVCEELLDLKL